MEEKVIFSIDFADSFKQISDVKGAIADLKKENKELQKSIEDGTKSREEANEQLAKNETALRELTTEQRNLQKAVDNTVKANKAEKDSIAANRAELARLTAEYIKLGKPTKEQTDKIKALSDKLKEQESAIGNTSRNVGNYSESIKSALKNVNIFGINVGQAGEALKKGGDGFKSMAKGADGASFSFKGLGKAILATGIGALALALIGLVQLFLKSEKGIELVSKAMTIFGAAVDVIIRRVEQFATGVGFILNGDFSKGVDALSGSFKGLGNEITQTVKAANDLADAQERLEDLEIDFIERRAKLRADIQDQRDLANDETKSIQERTNALKKALELQEELTKTESEIAKVRIQNAEAEFNLSARTDDDRRKFEEAKAAAFEDERQRTKEKIKIENELNTLVKQGATQSKKDSEEAAKADKERFAGLEKIKKESLTNQLKELEIYYAEADLKLKESLANGEITQEEYEKKIQDNKLASLDQQIIILETFGQEVADKEIELDNLVADNKIALREKDLEHQQEIAEKKKELDEFLLQAEQEIQDAKMQVAQDALSTIESLAKEGSAIQKAAFLGSQAFALADVIINTQEQIAANNTAGALQAASAAVLPFPANIAAETAIASKTLIKNILAGVQGGIAGAKIAATAVKSFFAEGVIGLQGAGTETSDSIDARLSKGESVITARATRKFAPILAQMEMAVGNKPNYQIKDGKFADGFIDGGFASRQSANAVNQRLFGTDIENALRNFKPVVQVSEINRVNKNASQTVQVSEL